VCLLECQPEKSGALGWDLEIRLAGIKLVFYRHLSFGMVWPIDDLLQVKHSTGLDIGKTEAFGTL
jgi:hypothetical protein